MQTYKGTRAATNKLLEMISEGVLSESEVLLAALNHMSEHEVRDMAEANEFFPDDEDEE